MCAHCGCESLDAIKELTAEHDYVVELMEEATSALRARDLHAAAALTRRVAAVLGPHTAVEERGLFPAMAAECMEYVDGLVTDHRLIEDALRETADGTPMDAQWADRVERAFSALRDHIVKEEAGLFPAALATLTTACWDAVDRVRTEVGGQLRADHQIVGGTR